MDFLNDSCENVSLMAVNSSTTALDPALYCSAVLPVIFGIICFLGILGNCVLIYTILKKTKCRAKHTVPDVFIFNLSIVDLLFLLGMPFLIHQLLGNSSWHFGAAMCTVITALDSNSQIVSTYILTAMTLDRYLATVHPIRFNYVRTPCVAALVVGLVWTLSLLTILPVWMYSGLMPLPDGLVGCALLLPNPVADTYWFTLCQFFLAFALPLAVICLVFFKILRHVSTSAAPLPPRSLRARTRKVTRVAVAICLAFFICWAPYYILQLVHLGVQNPSTAFSYAYNIAIGMGYANSCMNPFIYIVLSETFRRQFLRAVRPTDRNIRMNPSSTEGGSVSLRTLPEGSGGLRRLPEGSGGLRRLPEGSGGLRTPPEGSGGLRTPPEGSGGLRTLPEGSGGLRTLPEGSGGLRRLPEGSGGLRTLPEGSVSLRRLPEGSGGLRRLPEGSGGLRRLPEGSGGLRTLPEGSVSLRRLPEGSGGF